MKITEQIKRQNQQIARGEKLLQLERLKKRRTDTRRKIELGGLVIKAQMDAFNKAVILGVLDYAWTLIKEDADYQRLFEARGNNLFNLK